ncbi:hypothetical protein CR513_53361, partial [Mucuna pruriens]
MKEGRDGKEKKKKEGKEKEKNKKKDLDIVVLTPSTPNICHFTPSFHTSPPPFIQVVPSPLRLLGRHLKIRQKAQHRAKEWNPKLLWFDLEIENVTCRNRKSEKDMTGNYEDCHNYGKDPLEGHYKTTLFQPLSFKLKPTLINMMQNAGQFRGLPIEYPLAHLKKFLYFIDIVRIDNVPINAIRLRLFSFSLMDRMLEWLPAILDGTITT